MMSERRSGPRATSALVGVAVALASPAIRQRRPARAGVAVVSLALGVMLSGCALGTSSHASASRAQPAVLVDAHATCPKDPTQV
ncbi:MAG: hypothetical protein JOZ41_13330, partial [Chloroflexi bacterium]|nr:hypothetical protein [Chloroflexota bacterium]